MTETTVKCPAWEEVLKRLSAGTTDAQLTRLHALWDKHDGVAWRSWLLLAMQCALNDSRIWEAIGTIEFWTRSSTGIDPCQENDITIRNYFMEMIFQHELKFKPIHGKWPDEARQYLCELYYPIGAKTGAQRLALHELLHQRDGQTVNVTDGPGGPSDELRLLCYEHKLLQDQELIALTD